MAQLFVRSLRDGVVTVPLEEAGSIATLRAAVQGRCGVPSELQRLRCGLRELRTDTDTASLRSGDTVCLLLRLVGGKGGFGSLLRVQGRDTKATTNFEACRDLSGRRLRHVNAVKKMEEWKDNVKDRELEQTALKYVKESARNERRQKRKAVDPEVVSSMQKTTVSNVKDAVQSALETVKEGSLRTVKKRRFVHDDDESSDCSSDSEDEASLQSATVDDGDASSQKHQERESVQTSTDAESESPKNQTLDV